MNRLQSAPRFVENLDPQGLIRRMFPEWSNIHRFQASYESLTDGAPVGAARVPKIIHQIWMGSPLPTDLEKLRRTWLTRHPQWEYRLWTDVEIKAFEFSTRDLFDSTTCYGQRSDILRAEILARYGGVYVDLDYFCHQSIDELVEGYDFFASLRHVMAAHLGWREVWHEPVVVCNSIIGAKAGHPILKKYLDLVRLAWSKRDQFIVSEGELHPIALYMMGGKSRADHVKQTGLSTYLTFHKAVIEAMNSGGTRDLALPPSFFNPIIQDWQLLYLMPEFWQAWKTSGAPWPKIWQYSGIRKHTFADHQSKARWAI